MTANLRSFLARGTTLVAPGASDALSARLIEAHGYECVYVGSYATAASRFALPDTGRLSLEQLASHAKSIAAAVHVPVIADAEGFDDSVPAFEEAGVAAIHIEDHKGPGKHTSGPQELWSQEEAAERIRAACAVAEVRRRVAKPLMIVNDPEEEHAGASIVLYYAFSVATQFAALQRALAERNLASDTQPLEDFLGYKGAQGRSST